MPDNPPYITFILTAHRSIGVKRLYVIIYCRFCQPTDQSIYGNRRF